MPASFGANALNGLAAVAQPAHEGFTDAPEVLLLASTKSADDAAADDPLDAANDTASTAEAVVP